MRDVVLDFEVVHAEVLDGVHLSLELDGRKRKWLSLKLNFERLEVIVVDVGVAQGVDELAGFQA